MNTTSCSPIVRETFVTRDKASQVSTETIYPSSYCDCDDTLPAPACAGGTIFEVCIPKTHSVMKVTIHLEYTPKCKCSQTCAPKLINGMRTSEWGQVDRYQHHPYHWNMCMDCCD